jgi:hypothetical protein
MKNILLICILIALCLSTPFASAQDQAASNASAAPLQIQDGSASGATSSPSLFSPSPSPADVTPTASNQTSSKAAAPADPLAPGANSGAGSPGQNPPQSDPNSLIPPPVEPSQPSPINSAGNEEKQRQDQKAKYYAAKVKADKEESLASLLTKSDKAKSDETKREILREYYDLLAKRMKKIDPSISDWIDTMHAAYLRRLQQIRLEPSIPQGLPPMPDASASPSPSETPARHRKHKKSDNEDATLSAEVSPTPSKKSSSKAAPSPFPKSSDKKKADSNND